MIRLYIGGAGSGQRELAEKETGRKPDIENFAILSKEILSKGDSPQEYARHLVQENPDAVICSDEIGCGIHPAEKSDRIWREETGRALCIIAAAAGTVTRVFCGIGKRIK